MHLHVDDYEIDQEMHDMVEAWADFNEFGILPWDRNSKADDIILYWKNGIRFIDRMYNQAKANQRNKSIDSDIEEDIARQQRRKGIGQR